MCRIAGIISKTAGEAALQKMCDAMQHGGPDGAGRYTDPEKGVCFGHRRLALLDLSDAGSQPRTDTALDWTMIYNGEIYNFPELRREIEGLGHVFHGRSDTELVLTAFKIWGTACLRKFNGIFALAIYQRPQGKILLARDPAGVKPLYYAHQAKAFCFASEIRAFRAWKPEWPTDPDWQAHFLTFGFIPEPKTTLAGVRMLPAGNLLEYDLQTGAAKIFPWETDRLPASVPHSGKHAQLQVREALQQAVQRQLIADAPVGLFLSGGADSGILAAIAAQNATALPITISLRFEEHDYDEGRYQDQIVQKTGVPHAFCTVSGGDFRDRLEDYLRALDQPCNDGVNTYFIARYARQAGLKAAISGIGADEWFGGYPSFERCHLPARLRMLPTAGLRRAQNFATDRHRKLAFLSIKGPVGDYLFFRGFFTPRQTAELTGQSETAIWHQLQETSAETPPGTGRAYISNLEQAYFLKNQLLRDADVMGMWHGLEIRAPFLDLALRDTLNSIPPVWRLPPGKPKQLLTAAFRDALPAAILNRPKRGFTFPFARWFRQAGLPGELPQLDGLYRQFLAGRLHWSRFWVAYLHAKIS